MSIRITAFACEFRCGRIAVKASSLFEHEKTCARNPERRACKTCRHDTLDPYEPDTGAGGDNQCAIDQKPAGKRMVVDCPHWEPIVPPAAGKEVGR